jgi:hypothetical protein
MKPASAKAVSPKEASAKIKKSRQRRGFVSTSAMPVTADLFPYLFDAFTHTATFSETTIEAVEKTLIEKNGKPTNPATKPKRC